MDIADHVVMERGSKVLLVRLSALAFYLASSRTHSTIVTVVVVILDRSLTLDVRPDILHLGLMGWKVLLSTWITAA